jgi:hypothetical protein
VKPILTFSFLFCFYLKIRNSQQLFSVWSSKNSSEFFLVKPFFKIFLFCFYIYHNKKITTQFSVWALKFIGILFGESIFNSFFKLFLSQNKKITTQFFSVWSSKNSLKFLLPHFFRFFLFCFHMKMKRSQHSSSQFWTLKTNWNSFW